MIGERDRLLEMVHRERMARLAAEARIDAAVAEAERLAEAAHQAFALYARESARLRRNPIGELTAEQVVVKAKALLAAMPAEPDHVVEQRRGELAFAERCIRGWSKDA